MGIIETVYVGSVVGSYGHGWLAPVINVKCQDRFLSIWGAFLSQPQIGGVQLCF